MDPSHRDGRTNESRTFNFFRLQRPEHTKPEAVVRHGLLLFFWALLLLVPSSLCNSSQPTMITPESLFSQNLLNGTCPISAGLEADDDDQEECLIREDTPYYEHIRQAALTYNVDAALICAVIITESSFDPRAVSRQGAKGLMQLMPETARTLGVKNIFDPARNIDGGVRYLRLLLDRFEGDVRLALAAYNLGTERVDRHRAVPPYPETRQFIRKVLRYQKKFRAEALAAMSISRPS